jgi:hypothetical protein
MMLFLGEPIPENIPEENYDNYPEETNVCRDIKDTFALMIDKKMLLVTPVICWSGISNCIFGSIFFPLITRAMANDPKNYPDETTKNS